MKKIILSTFLISFTVTLSIAQIEELIPSKASLVVGINAKQVMGKLDSNILMESEFIQDWGEKVEDRRMGAEKIFYYLLTDTKATGLSKKENWYLFVETTESYSVVAGLIPLENKEKGMESINALTRRGMGDSEITKNKKYSSYSMEKSQSVAWNDSYALITKITVSPNRSRYEDNYYEKRDSLLKLSLQSIHKSVFSGKSKNSMVKDEEFQEKLAESHDAFIWASTEYLSLGSSLSGRQNRLFEKYINYMKTSLKGSFISLDFNESDITSNFEITLNEETLALVKELNNTTINPVLGKYIDQEKASAVFNSSMNTQALIPFYKKVFLDAAQLEEHIAPIGEDIYALYDLVIDQEAILKLWGGDFALAYEGMTDQVIEYSTYEYDDEYNSTKITKKDTIEVPQLVFAMTSDDPKHIQNIINIIEKTVPVVIKEEGYYEVAFHKTLYYFALVDNVLIVTNIKDRVTKHLNGLPSQNRYQFDSKYNNYAQVDLQKSFAPYIKANKEAYHTEEYDLARTLIDFVTDFTYTGTTIENNSVKSSMKLSLQNTKGGSLTTFFSMIDQHNQYRKESRITNENYKSPWAIRQESYETYEEAPAEMVEEYVTEEATVEEETTEETPADDYEMVDEVEAIEEEAPAE